MISTIIMEIDGSSYWQKPLQMMFLQVERNFLLMSIAYAANIGTNFCKMWKIVVALENNNKNIDICKKNTLQVGLVLSLDLPLTWLYLKFSTRWFDWLTDWLSVRIRVTKRPRLTHYPPANTLSIG